MLQQRLTERLISQWRIWRENDNCPDISKLNKAALADIWESCLLIKAQPGSDSGALRYQYMDVGSNALKIFKENPIGLYFTPSQKVMPAARLMRRLEELTPQSEPLMDDGQFVNEKSRVVKFRSCLVPFGTPTQITHVIVGLSWREY